MRSVGIRQLKANVSELLRAVDEGGEIIEITRHGYAIARLIPARAADKGQDMKNSWADLNLLAAEISAKWTKEVTLHESLNDVRPETMNDVVFDL